MESRAIGTWTLLGVAALVAVGCERGPSAFEQAETECLSQLEGWWEGPAAGAVLTLHLAPSMTAPGCHLRGSWFLNQQPTGWVNGSMTRLATRDSVHIELNPAVTTCALGEDTVEPQLLGTLAEDSIFGHLIGGTRPLPPSWDCTDPSDTIVAFDMTPVTFLRIN